MQLQSLYFGRPDVLEDALNSSHEIIDKPLSYFNSCIKAKEMGKKLPDLIAEIENKFIENFINNKG